MKITLKKMNIVNFKGIKNMELNFSDHNEIKGQNETGKSTVFDAFTWLLFGKNQFDNKKFNIVPIENNKHVHVIPEVVGLLLFDTETVKIKRILKTKFDKEGNLTGTITSAEWNDAPLKISDFNKRIADLINENFFKLLSNPLYFNSLAWEKRREMLLKLANPLSDIEVLKSNKELQDLAKLLENKTLQDLKAETSAKIKKLKDIIAEIPVRIDETERNKPEQLNFAKLKKELQTKIDLLTKIEEQIKDKSKILENFNLANIKKKNEIAEKENILYRKKQDVIFEYNNKFTESERKLKEIKYNVQSLELELKDCDNSIYNCNRNIENFDNQVEKLRKEYEILANSKQDANSMICGTCNQELPTDKIHEITELFNQNKAENLEKIRTRALNAKSEILKEQEYIAEKQKDITALETKIKEKKQEIEIIESFLLTQKEVDFTENEEITNITLEVESLKQALAEIKPPTVNETELKEKKQVVNTEIIELRNKLNVENTIKESNKRIGTLKAELKDKANQLLLVEKIESDIIRFTKIKVSSLEKTINSKFSLVNFRMFEIQKNGEEKPVCQTLVNGIDFSEGNLNTGTRINAGLEIINIFSEFYDIKVPIFIDNAESVSKLIDTNTQRISLIHDKNINKLQIDAL